MALGNQHQLEERTAMTIARGAAIGALIAAVSRSAC